MTTLHILASATDQFQGFTAFDMMLMSAIGVVVTGVAGLVTWIVKSAGPRLMLAFEKRNDAMVAASEKTADAVSKIPEAIKSFEIALLGQEKRLFEKIDDSHDKMVEAIHDKRLDAIAEVIRTGPHPAQTGAQLPPEPPPSRSSTLPSRP